MSKLCNFKWLFQATGIYLFQGMDLSFRRWTARWRVLPCVFIIGAPKSGTSSLAHAISCHPAYVAAFTKELLFLQDLPNFRSYYERNFLVKLWWGSYQRGGLNSYRKFFPMRHAMRAATQNAGVPARTGDHTVYYLYCPVAAKRVKEFCPEARLIVVLRNPVDRAYSDYNMMYNYSTNEQRPFEKSIEDELSGACTFFRLNYINKGIYEPPLRRWMNLFDRKQFMIINSNSLFENFRSTVCQVYDFLGIPPHDPDDLPVVMKGKYKTPMKKETRAMLEDYFRPYNQKLHDFVGISW